MASPADRKALSKALDNWKTLKCPSADVQSDEILSFSWQAENIREREKFKPFETPYMRTLLEGCCKVYPNLIIHRNRNPRA